MQYKLFANSENDYENPIDTILHNRGIKDTEAYLKLNESCIEGTYNKLDNIDKAVECFDKHFLAHDAIAILVDSDPDGYTSGSMMYNYIKEMDAAYPVFYMLHEKNKAHGLNDMDFNVPKNTKLLILPDSSTNDSEICNKLIDLGIDIIILDHHIAEESAKKSKAIIVNNQTSEQYTNKEFSGAGIVYEFLRALDNYYWQEHADNYLDLCALGNISDVMNLATPQTRYIADQGLYRIKNKFLQALIAAQDYSMNGEVTIHNVSWYITPIVNAMIRIGPMEDRDILFKAFIGEEQMFDYKKRDGTIVQESIYEHAARLCKNIKGVQDRARDKLLNDVHDDANPNDKVVMLQTDNPNSGILGLSAMKLADMMKRPVIIVKPFNKNGVLELSGSGRNFNNSPIESLKDQIDKTGLFTLAQGHANALGVSLLPENFEAARQCFNDQLKDVEYDSNYICDFVLDADELEVPFVQKIHNARYIWCHGVEEPLVAIENIVLSRQDIFVMGKNYDSIGFTYNDIRFVQFKLKDGDPIYDFVNEWEGQQDDMINVDVVGECSINTYKGMMQPQFVIKDLNISWRKP